MKKFYSMVLCFLLASNTYASNAEKLFYLTPDLTDSSFSTAQLQQIKDHAKSIDILAPQIYKLDENGVIWGSLDPRIISLAKENNIRIMPLIINPGFNQEIFHSFLHNPSAQERAISDMVLLCEKYHFYGIQFDFENISINDKNEFNKFFQITAARLHQNGFSISIAVIPQTANIPSTDYEKWFFENWSGAYDYKVLGQSGDFISIMSYDRHTSLTTPGPIAAIDWVEKTIKDLLKFVPAGKISLGVPDYSGYWSTGRLDPGNVSEKFTYRSKESQISYSKMSGLLEKSGQALIWQDQWKSSSLMYGNNDRIEYLFVEDAKSFQAKLALSRRYQLRGISVWKLGLEDPAIWNMKIFGPAPG